MTWARRHLLDVDDLSVEEIDLVLERAEALPGGAQAGGAGGPQLLAGQRVALLFEEASTRTRLSFEIAARNLGAETFVIDPGGSSLVKGESLADTARNLAALGIGVLVLRHHRSGAPWVVARHFHGHVVNAGDGWHAHPTQALLDLLTLRRAWGVRRLDGRKVAIVGDLLHSRVARSNIWTLTASGADVWVCGPPQLLGGYADGADWAAAGRSVTATDDLERALDGTDAVMALRIQRERMSRSSMSLAEYVARYRIDEPRMAAASPGAVFLHPGPVNEGVEVTHEVATGPRSLVLEQVRNGVPVRMAVLSLLDAAPRYEASQTSRRR